MSTRSHQGLHHVGLATHDMEATLDFYEQTLGFSAVVCEAIEPASGGCIRHAFFDTGGGELLAFMECNDVEGVRADFDAGINRGLGTGSGVYHFAFAVSDPEALAAKRDDLVARGVKVRGIVDHGWCQSIYFRDPNFVQLEFCCTTATFDAEHAAGRTGAAWRRYARS